MGITSLIILGRFGGPDDLAGAAMGTTYANVVGCSLMVGIAESIETLGSQAVGAQKYQTLGHILQRGSMRHRHC